MIIELFIFFFSLFILSPIFKIYYRRFKLPPGPFPYPFLGNLHQIDHEKPFQTIVDWSKIYGPVFTVWLAHEPKIMITDYDILKKIFVTDHLANSRPFQFNFNFVSRGKSIVVASGDVHKEARAFFLKTIRTMPMEEISRYETKQLVQSILDEMGPNNEITLNITPLIMLCVINVSLTVLCDSRFEKVNDEFLALTQAIRGSFTSLGHPLVLLVNGFPWLRHVPLFGRFGYNNMDNQEEVIGGFLVRMVEEHKILSALKENAKDFLALHHAEMIRREQTDDFFSEEYALGLAGEMLTVGTETIIGSSRWAILLMMKYPHVQKKVCQEIDEIVGQNRWPTMVDRQSMPYVQATLNEVLRFGNLLTFNLPRSHDTNIQLLDYTIPKNTHLIPQWPSLMYDENVFPEPYEFKPERFLEGKELAKIKEFMPFSLGNRQCPGETYARTVQFFVFVSLMQKFNFFFTENDPQETEMRRTIGFSSIPWQYDSLIRKR